METQNELNQLFEEFFEELEVEYINREWETRYGFRPL
jgi:hypothetical protein